MQSALQTNSPAQRLRQWFSDALFTRRTAAEYFGPLIQAVDPDWTPGKISAVIEAIHTETHNTKTFILRPSKEWQGFKSGQHVATHLEVNGRGYYRTFTIASTPAHFAKTGTLALTIKKTENGRVTPWLHTQNIPGARINISQATGDFQLPAQLQGPILYMAAGSGITPVMSHLRSLVEQQFPLPVRLLYYARSQRDFIFLKELKVIAKASPRFQLFVIATQDVNNERHLQGRISPEHLTTAFNQRIPTQIYICGPRGFYTSAMECLAQSDAHNIPVIQENFGGLSAAATNGTTHNITFTRSALTVDAAAQTNLLETAEKNGLTPNAGCRMGICHTCKCQKSTGRVRNLITGEISDDGEEMIQLCISSPETDITLAL